MLYSFFNHCKVLPCPLLFHMLSIDLSFPCSSAAFLLHLSSHSWLLHAILPKQVTVLHSPGVKQPLSYRDCNLQSQLAGTEVIHISSSHQIFKFFAFSSLCEKKTLRKCHFIFPDFAQSWQYGTFNPGSFLPMGPDHCLLHKHPPAAV